MEITCIDIVLIHHYHLSIHHTQSFSRRDCRLRIANKNLCAQSHTVLDNHLTTQTLATLRRCQVYVVI